MSSKSLALVVALSAAANVAAQGFTPLASKRFTYTALPYQADTDTTGERGAQFGYNVCNSTTEGPESLCQTAFINSIDDFCLWGPPEPDSLIGDTEGEAVAWCTKPGRGTRLIPEGTITGVQFIKTPDYVQVTGTIRQELINIEKDDSGGEMDPHGADQRGNPLGGLLFSNAFGGDASSFTQVVEWHNFMGGKTFCLKACDPAGPNAARFCEHVFDRIGCWYNAPAPYEEGTFESCLGDNQDFPGIYTGADGRTTTYSQPPESLGEIKTMPYQPVRPSSSQCSSFSSAVLFAGAPAASLPPLSRTSTTTTGTGTGRTTTTRSTTRTTGTTSSTTTSGAARGVELTMGAGLVVAVAVAFVGVF